MYAEQFNKKLKTRYKYIFKEFPDEIDYNEIIARKYLDYICEQLGEEDADADVLNAQNKPVHSFQIMLYLDNGGYLYGDVVVYDKQIHPRTYVELLDDKSRVIKTIK